MIGGPWKSKQKKSRLGARATLIRHYCCRLLSKGPSIKDVRTKSRKINPLPPCPCGHTINFEKSDFLHQKVRTSISEEPPPHPCPQHVGTGQTLLPPDVFYGRFLKRLFKEVKNHYLSSVG